MNQLITVGQLLDQTWDHYRDNFQEIMTISAWILILAVIDVIALSFYPSASQLISGGVLTGSETFGVILALISSGIAAPLISLWLFIALARLIRSQLAGGRRSAKAAMHDGFKLYWSSLYISLLIMAVLVGGLLIGMGPSFLIAALMQFASSSALVVLFNILLLAGIVVAFILVSVWGVQYILSPFALFLENLRGFEALRRSRSLIKGRFWSVLLRLVIPKLIFLAVAVLILAVLQYLIGLGVTGVSGLNLDLQLRLGTLSQAALAYVIVALINPLIIIADTLLYKNLIKK